MMKKQRAAVSPEALLALVCAALTAVSAVNAGRLSDFFGQVFASSASDAFILLETEAGAYARGSAAERGQLLSSDEAGALAAQPDDEEARRTEEPTAYETPADILEMERDYLAAVSDAAVCGTVYERFFVNDGATDVIGRVAVRNCTETASPDFASLLAQGAALEITDPSQPTVLIYHTHTTESYLLSDTGSFYRNFATRSNDPAQNMVRVGNALCEALEARGIGVIHDTAVYDETYNGAYARSRVSVEEYLRRYPSVKIVLDVHRDAIYDSDTSACKPTAVIDGRKAAQIMIITGVEEGPVTDFPDWERNLRFALALQNKAQTMYEGLMKPVYFCRRKYNMDLSPCGLLLEFGSDTNTLAEAVYAGRMLGDALGALIEEYAKNE